MKKCFYCDEGVEPNGGTRVGGHHAHVECALRSVVGSLGHLQKKCSCYGGTEEDPPEMTRREAAKAASDYYHITTPTLTVFVVYAQPSDYPDMFVVRGQDVLRDGTIRPHAQILGAAKTLEEVRKYIPEHCVMLARDERDEPHIVETWL
jgi:hypothetical protein